MYVIKKMNVAQYSLLSAIISALFGTFPAIISFGWSMVIRIFCREGYYSSFDFFGSFVFFVVPIISFIFGYIYGAIFCSIYNYLAEHDHGLEIDIEMLPEVKQ
jgi:hypothetical protein